MEEQTKEGCTSVSLQDIEELKAIYEDYLYMVRHHELVFLQENIYALSFRQVHSMYPDCQEPGQFAIPWAIEQLDANERQEFTDYINNNIRGDGRKTYVSIQHIKAEENNGKGPLFAIEPYSNLGRTMQFPSMIEEYTLSYPEGATLGNTEFFIDGCYKSFYLGNEASDKLIADCINDPDLVEEISVMLKLGESFRQNGYRDDEKFGRMAVNVYASEVVNINENNLLEILGIFAEKVRKICHARYHNEDCADDIKMALNEGFLHLPDNFQDYINIRDLMRHQWDTLDDLDDFSLQKSEENKRVRAERIRSYLKICDKSLYQRMLAFVEVLHQMQQIICEIEPNRITRGMNESNSKFVKRVKHLCRQNPDKQIEVEMNYPFDSEKYEVLNKILHKSKVFPNIKIVDDLRNDQDKLDLMLNYGKRSCFLRDFHDIACCAMGYCQRRGEDKDSRGAWSYLRKIRLITREECQKWQDYTTLRNNIAHGCFNADLREQLKKKNGKYIQDFRIMAQKLYDTGPDVTKIQDNVFKYEHTDGEVAMLNYTSHDRETSKKTIELREKKRKKASQTPQKEFYDNGIEFKIDNGEIIGVKLPNNVYINMNNKSMICGRIRWYSGSEYFNALQTETSTIRTDKELKVTSFFEGKREIFFADKENILLDGCHNLLLDVAGHMEELTFKSAEHSIIKTEFRHLENGQNLISFTDGTKILFSEDGVSVIHADKVLSYDTRKEFASTYDTTLLVPQQIVKHTSGR